MPTFELLTSDRGGEQRLVREIESLDDFLFLHLRGEEEYLADCVVDYLGFKVFSDDGEAVFHAPLPGAINYERVAFDQALQREHTPLPPPEHEVFAKLVHDEVSPTNFFVYTCAYWTLFLEPGLHVLKHYSRDWGGPTLIVCVVEDGTVYVADVEVDANSPTEFDYPGWWEGVTPESLLARTAYADMDPSRFPWLIQLAEPVQCDQLALPVADWLRGTVSLAQQWWRLAELCYDQILATGFPDPPVDGILTTFGYYLDDVAAEIEAALR